MTVLVPQLALGFGVWNETTNTSWGRIHAWDQASTSWPEMKVRKRRPGMPLMTWSSPHSLWLLLVFLLDNNRWAWTTWSPGKHSQSHSRFSLSLFVIFSSDMISRPHASGSGRGTYQMYFLASILWLFTCVEGEERHDTIPAATSVRIWTWPGVFPALGVINLIAFPSSFIIWMLICLPH